MDEQVAQTLGELERKLAQLERTLTSIGGAEPAGASEREPASTAADPPRTAAEPPGESWGATEDEQWAAGRIVDERIEPSVPPDAPRREGELAQAAAHEQGGGQGAAQAWSVPPRTQGAGFANSSPASAVTSSRAQAPRSAAAPSAAELLRFRERLEQTARQLTHDYDELLGRLSYAAMPATATAGPTISFARGAPSLDIVDVAGLRESALRAFDSDPAGSTAYGTSVGYPRLRAWIADRHGVEHERVLVTNGSMQADAFLFEQLVRPGDDVIVERPTYDRTLLSLRQRGAWVHQVELEPDGINTEVLGQLLAGASGVRPKLAHIIPNFQNPAGYTLSLAKRRRLLELAAEHDFVLFEDDPYVALRFSGEPLPTMLSMDPERVVYASSFSKTVCPGVRVGYLVGPPQLIGAIAQLATNTYISPSMVAQSIVYEFCASGAIERSIETVRAALAERAETLAQALAHELPEAQFVPPQGGYFMWVTLPPGTDVGALHHAAAERGVAFVKGTDFLLEGGENTLRLAYSGVTPQEIRLGVARLAEAYRSL